MTTTIEAREPQTEGTHERDESEPVKDGLVLPPKWSPYAGSLATEVQLRVQALPEVTLTEITVCPRPSVGRPKKEKEACPAGRRS